MINIAVLGYGTIGSGVVEIVDRNQTILQKKTRQSVEVKYILDIREFPGTSIESKLVHDFQTIVNDPDVQVIVETMGGLEPAYTYAKESLLAGKAYVTSNKELVAKYGAKLLALAKSQNTNFLFEASVGGGIPVIHPLNRCLTGDEILEISGILNGTTNYILTQMTEEGWSFEDALKDAQEKGYAEFHPEADIEGHDARRKIAILGSLAVGRQIDFEDVYTEGITKITAADISYAEAMDCKIKLLGTYKNTKEGQYAMVAPKLVPLTQPLSGVSGVFNSIFVKGDMVGDVMFYGPGAGKLPTASAVIGDVVDAIKHLDRYIGTIWEEDKLVLQSLDSFEQKVFVRMKDSVDKSKVKEAFGDVEEITTQKVTGEYAFLTGVMKEKEMSAKLSAFPELISFIRMA
ncbi:MAG: homoserine dehydrogenase [Lachnospiraceae bacterium]|nr:homoserine dehydrogenase [Lachnospiraceae bacterium]